jgi:hypothetical protein
VEGAGPPQHPFAIGPWYWAVVRYADGTALVFVDEEKGAPRPPVDLEPGVLVQGPKGRLYGPRRSDPPGLARRFATVREPDLMGFEEAVRTRYGGSGNKPNVFAAHHSCTVVNMVNIAIRLRRALRFDPVAQQFVGDDAAGALAEQPMRAPWHM